MNKETLTTFYRYNAFANELLFDTIDGLEGVDLSAESPSRNSIITLMRHMLMVDSAYFHLALQQEFDRGKIPSDAAGIRAGMQQLAIEQTAYFKQADAQSLGEKRAWAGITLPLNELLTQAVMHSIQHRSEISLLLAQQGHQMTDLDIIKFFIHESGQEWPW